MARDVVLPEGIELDREGGTIVVAGVRVPVGYAMLSPAHFRTEKLRVVDGTLIRTPLLEPEKKPEPLSIHTTLLTGENGHWVELSIWPEQDFYGPAAMSAGLPDGAGEYSNDPREDVDAAWITHLLLTARERTDAPPNHAEPDYYDAFGGLTPGTWSGFEWLDEDDPQPEGAS